MGQYDHLVPSAHKISQETGFVMGERVALADPQTGMPDTNRKSFNIKSVSGDDFTIGYDPPGMAPVRMTVKRGQLFATSLVRDLVIHDCSVYTLLTARKVQMAKPGVVIAR